LSNRGKGRQSTLDFQRPSAAEHPANQCSNRYPAMPAAWFKGKVLRIYRLTESRRISATHRLIDEQAIGREHFHKRKYEKVRKTNVASADQVLRKIARRDRLRACISSTYLREMRLVCLQMTKALRPGGYLVLITGNNLVRRQPFLTSRYPTRRVLSRSMDVLDTELTPRTTTPT
jgi:hypothetical protein